MQVKNGQMRVESMTGTNRMNQARWKIHRFTVLEGGGVGVGKYVVIL